MKLKLLFGALAFSAITAQAQVTSISENFNSFVSTGNVSFPQNGWSAVLPPLSNPDMPPAPMMLIYAEPGDASNKFVSAYSGGNINSNQYLVAPQIVAPTGNTTVSFKARKNAQGGAVMVQVGLASSPTDMTTFVPMGALETLTTNTYQTITRVVPSSSSTYIVIKSFSPAGPHTSADFDDFLYDTTPVGTINENFNTFSSTPFGSGIPQNGWKKSVANAPYNVYIAANNGSNAAQFYAANVTNTPSYLIAPRITAPDGTKKLRFTTGLSNGSDGDSTIEAGLVTDYTDMSTFTSLGAPITITTSNTTPQTFTLDVPASTKQYVVWKFSGAGAHSAVYIDNVIYDVQGNLGTSDINAHTNTFKFVINANNEIQFVGKNNVKSVKVYSASGNLVAQGAVNNNRFNVSSLSTGVYIFTTEDNSGLVNSSKFIKK